MFNYASINRKRFCFYFTHSKYYHQWTGGLPYAPFVYWNVITHDDIIPVCTYGYKNSKSVIKQIKMYIADVIECKLLHTETEQESDIQKQRLIRECVNSSKENSNPYL